MSLTFDTSVWRPSQWDGSGWLEAASARQHWSCRAAEGSLAPGATLRPTTSACSRWEIIFIRELLWDWGLSVALYIWLVNLPALSLPVVSTL